MGGGRASSSLGWTIPRGPVELPRDSRAASPPCTKYQPSFCALDKHVPMTKLQPRRPYQFGPDFSAPGSHNPKPLPKPHLFVSKLPRDSGGFLAAARTDSPDFWIRPKGLAEVPARGGTIPRTGRSSPVVGSGSTIMHKSDTSLVDALPPTRSGNLAYISKCPVPRAAATKQRTSNGDPYAPSAFEKCGIPSISFPAARSATRRIELDGDDFAHIDDPHLQEDLKFLQGVREDIRRWDLKSRFH